MAKEYRKTTFLRVGTAFMRRMLALGVGGKGMHVLSVVEADGGVHTTPVTVVELGDRRWLVAQYGPTRWVQSVRAAGSVELRRGRRRERLDAVEVPHEEAAPILREYVQRVSIARPYFDASHEDPVEAFLPDATKHPVFRLES